MSSKPADPAPSIPSPPTMSIKPTFSDPDRDPDSDTDSESQTFHDAATHFSPEDEATLLSEAYATKSEANSLFSQKRYSEAISTYDRALASCPNYLDYEIAVLKSNISACHVQLQEWKAAVDSATEALDGLERIDPTPKLDKDKDKKKATTGKQEQQSSITTVPPSGKNNENNDGAVIELPDSEDETSALARLSLSDARRTDIGRIRLKSLLRRARARHRQATWSSLTGAQEDYTLLLSLLTTPSTPNNPTSPGDLATVRNALRVLPGEINVAKEKEMGEMMGKLKELGNGILKPFGLSTDNFKMVKDEKTGGYSMNFEGGKGK